MEENKKRHGGRVFFIIMLVAIILIAGIAAIAIVLEGKGTEKNKSEAKADANTSLEIGAAKEYNEKNTDGTLTSVQVAEKVKPSVMAVIIYRNGAQLGEGSGIFMSVDKSNTYTYVLTCAHIVNYDNISVKIQLENKAQYAAEVVGLDTRTDVAVLRVKATGFTVAEFGDSSVLKVGEPVYAIGNPGGTEFFGSFTGGFVSAIDRPTSTSSSSYTMECIQHDAAINPGNSGGALVNSFGQVIGMNSSKIAAEEYEGMGFAIPVNVAKNVVDDLLVSGYVQNRAKLGISYLQAEQNEMYTKIVKMNKLPNGSIIIADIAKDSPLYGTDVIEGDMIIGVNGKDLANVDILLKIIENSKPGDKIELTFAHINNDYTVNKFTLTVALVEDKGTPVEAETPSSDDGGFVNPYADK